MIQQKEKKVPPTRKQKPNNPYFLIYFYHQNPNLSLSPNFWSLSLLIFSVCLYIFRSGVKLFGGKGEVIPYKFLSSKSQSFSLSSDFLGMSIYFPFGAKHFGGKGQLIPYIFLSSKSQYLSLSNFLASQRQIVK